MFDHLKSRRSTFAKVVIAAILLLGPGELEASAPCSISGAAYSFPTKGGPLIRFMQISNPRNHFNDLYLRLEFKHPDRTYFFTFDSGTARYVLLESVAPKEPNRVTDSSDFLKGPLDTMHYIAADKALQFDERLPNSNTPAPAYILLPDLGERMWYSDYNQRRDVPLAFFKLAKCGK